MKCVEGGEEEEEEEEEVIHILIKVFSEKNL